MFNLFSWLLPYRCCLCNQDSKQALDLCKNCYLELPWHQQSCQHCGRHSLTTPCGECLQKPPPYQQVISAFDYEYPVDHMLIQMKYHNQLPYIRVLAQCFVNKLIKSYPAPTLPDIIVPVPLHNTRILERGYNQSLELLKLIHKQLTQPILLDRTLCQRQRQTSSQTFLTAIERRRNMKSAFTVNSTIKDKHITIFDDVITTGATVNELAKTLIRAGAKRVDVWCIARRQ